MSDLVTTALEAAMCECCDLALEDGQRCGRAGRTNAGLYKLLRDALASVRPDHPAPATLPEAVTWYANEIGDQP